MRGTKNQDIKMNIETKELNIVVPFFPGFYESSLSVAMDDAIEARASDEGLEYNDCFDKYDFKAAQLAITQKWLKNFNEKTGLNIKFHDIDSPREYNFTTDRVFGTIKKDEFQKIRDVVSFDALKSVVERTFTSRDGFISFYTTDMDHWMGIPTEDLDHNETQTILKAFLIDKDYNDWSFVYDMEEAADKGWKD